MNQALYSDVLKILKEDRILHNEPMCLHTTFRVGGPADTVLVPEREEEAVALLRLFSDSGEPFFLLGNGSNLLVSDRGYRGTVILIDHNLSGIEKEGDRLIVQAGTLLSKAAAFALQEGLAGMEFASGIPGTLGGGVTMNAGAYGGEMKDIVESVRLFDCENGKIQTVVNTDMHFAYRHSLVKEGKYVVLSAVLKLHPDEPSAIRARMDELKEKRVSKQPLEYPSAGSTFKRPEGYFAGKLIEDAGLRGFSIGDAMVSEKHAGFVINKGNATAEEIIRLIRHIREEVHAMSGVWLEPEVCMLGEGLDL
ncbi:MAG: UDP-N-acetylmuramate dehydrogenase [Lachnospiraceae bacterium]|nr:UDP-N-acetylmuramate dehydrogenase [Lachnospiraceae bacterium]